MEMQVKPLSTGQGHCGGHPAGGNLLIAVTVKSEQDVPLLAEGSRMRMRKEEDSAEKE